MLENDHENPVFFYVYIKLKKQGHFGELPLNKDDLTYSAYILNEQFTSIFSNHGNHPSAINIKVTEKGDIKLLQNLKPHKQTYRSYRNRAIRKNNRLNKIRKCNKII